MVAIFVYAAILLPQLPGADVLFVGFSQFAGGRYFALREPSGNRTGWFQIGDTFAGKTVVGFDADKEQLKVKDIGSGQLSTLSLPKTRINPADMALPRADAIAKIRNLIELPLREKGREVKLEDLPPAVRIQIEAMEKPQAPLAAPPNLTNVGPAEAAQIKDKMKGMGYEIAGESVVVEKYHVDAFAPLKLTDLPQFLAQNITQADLDALVPVQVKVMQELAQKSKSVK